MQIEQIRSELGTLRSEVMGQDLSPEAKINICAGIDASLHRIELLNKKVSI